MKSVELNNNMVVVIPDNWDIERHGETISLYDVFNGIGALQITSYTVSNNKEINLVDELINQLEGKFGSLDVKLIHDYAFVESTDEDNIHWRYWLLTLYDNVIFVSYNCEVVDIGKEDKIVDFIVKSIV